MLENFSNNDLKNIIDSAYRRFLLRSCNERISLFEFVFKLKISPQKLNLYNKIFLFKFHLTISIVVILVSVL